MKIKTTDIDGLGTMATESADDFVPTSGGTITGELTVVQPAGSGLNFYRYDPAGGNLPTFSFYRGRGTIGTPEGVLSGDLLGGFFATGVRNDGTWPPFTTGRLAFQAEDNFTSATTGTRIEIALTPSGSSSRQNGAFLFSASTGFHVAASQVIDYSRHFMLRQYTVSTLPTAGTVGRLAMVTNALNPTFMGVLVGGGSTRTIAFDDGTAWVAH